MIAYTRIWSRLLATPSRSDQLSELDMTREHYVDGELVRR
jgi:hypothetical protein